MDSPKPEISIIVPIYNVEVYLRQCLDSIINQTFQNWECILVDDGSPDNSGAIIDEYALRDPRFKVIHRQNGGLSAARNSALKVAQGKYIGFVDSDDWADPRMFEELYRLIKQNDADMAQVGIYKEYKTMAHKKGFVKDLTIYNQGELIREAFHDKKLPSYMWNKLFRREVITRPFPEGQIFEDIYTLSYWIPHVKKGVFLPEPLYHYRFRKGSLSNVNSISNRLQYFIAFIKRFHHLANQGLDYIGLDERNAILWRSALSCAKILSRMTRQPKQKRLAALTEIKELCGKNLSAPQKGTLGWKEYQLVRLMLNHPKIYMKLMNFTHQLDLHSKYRMTKAYD